MFVYYSFMGDKVVLPSSFGEQNLGEDLFQSRM